MSDSQVQSSQKILVTPQVAGAVIEPQYTVRNITFYLLYESELDNILALGIQETISLTLVVFFASIGLSIYVSGAFYDQTPAMGKFAEMFVGPILFALAGFCGIWLKSVRKTKGQIWGRIKQESRKV